MTADTTSRYLAAAVAAEVDADLAANSGRAARWRPCVTLGATRIIALNGDYAGRVGTPTGLAGWTFDRAADTFSQILISADGGGPAAFDLDNLPPSYPVTAWALVGSVERARGMDLQAPNPAPQVGRRVLVLAAPVPWLVGHVYPVATTHGGRPTVQVDETPDRFYIDEWAILPDHSGDVEHALEVAFATLAEGLSIAPDGYDHPCVWLDTGDDDRPELLLTQHAAEPRVWALLAAVVPVREEAGS